MRADRQAASCRSAAMPANAIRPGAFSGANSTSRSISLSCRTFPSGPSQTATAAGCGAADKAPPELSNQQRGLQPSILRVAELARHSEHRTITWAAILSKESTIARNVFSNHLKESSRDDRTQRKPDGPIGPLRDRAPTLPRSFAPIPAFGHDPCRCPKRQPPPEAD
jgi:hypothetical protein